MVTIAEYKKKYGKLSKDEVRERAKSDSDFRAETEALYKLGFKEELNKSCSECWFDAYVLLMKSDEEDFIRKEESLFELRAGALLLDRKGGDSQ